MRTTALAAACLALALAGAPAGVRAATGVEAAAPGLAAGFGAAVDAPAEFHAAIATGAGGGSDLLPVVPGAGGGLLAQRTIEREWGPESDSLSLRQRAAGWKSEPFAFTASALLPGAGQAYLGESSALWFALAEVAGWTAHWLFRRDAQRNQDAAGRIVGNPADSTSGWSFQRWESGGTGRDASDLRALWAADPTAFYALIASDPEYLDGWGGASPAGTRASFEHQRDLADASTTRARWSEGGIGFTHLFAAIDALRAARLHNLPVRRNLELELRGNWSRRGPSLVAALERRF